MNSLPLKPLPAENSEIAVVNRQLREEGFVDEAVVRSVVMKGAYERVYVQREDMVLSSSEEDYAGWSLPVASPFRALVEDDTKSTCAPVRQPAPPVLERSDISEEDDPGIAEPYSGTHRWWLFGISGATTCAILSLTLLSLAQRSYTDELVDGYVPVIRMNQESADELVAEPPAIQRALTKVAASD